MKVEKINIKQFRHFIDQELKLSPYVTVLVGKNDTGKSSILSQLFQYYIKQSVYYGNDIPKLQNVQSKSIEFTCIWRIEDTDFKNFEIKKKFGKRKLETIIIDFFHGFNNPQEKRFSFYLNGESVEAYESQPDQYGRPILKREFRYFLDDMIPLMRYVNLSDRHLLMHEFEARFHVEPEFENVRPRELANAEEFLFELINMKAEVRESKGLDEPWPWHNIVKRPSLSINEIESKLKKISDYVTSILKEWWKDPPNLKFEIKLAGSQDTKEYRHKINRYLFIIQITDNDGLNYYGTGLRWFIAFAIEYLFIMNLKKPVIALFDEPAYNLHPSAQKIITKLLNKLSEKCQVIYSTHSPFLLDWNFPQRIRHFERDYKTKKTNIDNKPYIKDKPHISVWDRFKDSIGVSFGDVGFLGEKNIFVEGISDQILLANISESLEKDGKDHLNLNEINIVPFGSDEKALESILRIAKSNNRKSIVLCDKDKEGKKIMNTAKRMRERCINIGDYIENKIEAQNYSIEDLFGFNNYLNAVNSFYSNFSWFDHKINKKQLKKSRLDIDVNETLGKQLEKYFKKVFKKDFSKYEVSVFIADYLNEIDLETERKFVNLIRDINMHFEKK